jgi:hypothetical protein
MTTPLQNKLLQVDLGSNEWDGVDELLRYNSHADPRLSVIDLEQIKEDELNMVDEHNRTRDSRMSFYMSPPKHGRKSSQFDAKRLSSLIAHKENHSPNKNRKITITARPKRAQTALSSRSSVLAEKIDSKLSGVRIKKPTSTAPKTEATEALEITEPISKLSHTSRFVISTAPVTSDTGSIPSNPEDKKKIEQLEARISVLEFAFTAMQRDYAEAIRALQRQMQEVMSGMETEHSDC